MRECTRSGRPEPFVNIHDYDTWDAELGEDAGIQRHVAAGNLVPINTGSDGAFAFVVRPTVIAGRCSP